MLQGYICYKQKDNIEEFEALGNPNTRLSHEGAGFIGSIVNLRDATSCSNRCRISGATKYAFVDNSRIDSDMLIIDTLCNCADNNAIVINADRWITGSTETQLATTPVVTTPVVTTPVVTTPVVTTPIITTKPVKEESIIPGVPDLYFYIGLGIVGFILLLIIIMMMSSRSKNT